MASSRPTDVNASFVVSFKWNPPAETRAQGTFRRSITRRQLDHGLKKADRLSRRPRHERVCSAGGRRARGGRGPGLAGALLQAARDPPCAARTSMPGRSRVAPGGRSRWVGSRWPSRSVPRTRQTFPGSRRGARRRRARRSRCGSRGWRCGCRPARRPGPPRPAGPRSRSPRRCGRSGRPRRRGTRPPAGPRRPARPPAPRICRRHRRGPASR